MTAPRQVFGPARPNTIADWWEPTKIGAPLTPRMAFYLRRRMWSSTPGNVQRALAERGLLDDTRTLGSSLTELGTRLRNLLGELPRTYWPRSGKPWQVAPSEVFVECVTCGKPTNAELIAWGAGGIECVKCASS